MATAVENTRARVIEAAGQVFAAKGFEAATIREICRLGGANLAAVNYYFGDKQRLYLATVEYAYRQRAEQVPFPHWSADTPPRRKLADFVLTLITRMIGQGPAQWERELILREVARPSESCRELVHDFIRPQFAVLDGILAEIWPTADARKRHLLAFSVVGQCLHYRVVDPVVRMLVSPEEFATYEPSMLAEHITKLTLGGIQHMAQGNLDER
jgi:AcrR family transcriptional regulator